MNQGLKLAKIRKKEEMTDQIQNFIIDQEQVEKVDKVKDNVTLVKTNLYGNTVYYRVTVSEIKKNIDDWIDLAYEYKNRGKKNEKK